MSRKFSTFAMGSRCALGGVARVSVNFEDSPKSAGGRLGIEVDSYPSARVALDIREFDLEPLAQALTELVQKVQKARTGDLAEQRRRHHTR